MDNPVALKHAGKFPKLREIPKHPVPNIMGWGSHYGSDSQYDHPSRKLSTTYGTYHLSPVFDKSQTMSGYSLKFAHTGEGKQTALWHDLGLFTHQGKAIHAARKHHDSLCKKESLDEARFEKDFSSRKKHAIRLKRKNAEIVRDKSADHPLKNFFQKKYRTSGEIADLSHKRLRSAILRIRAAKAAKKPNIP